MSKNDLIRKINEISSKAPGEQLAPAESEEQEA